MNVVLDTCALLWLTLEPDSLSGKAHQVIAEATQLYVSSISVWEIGIKAACGRISLGTTYPDYVERLSNVSDFELVPIDHRLWAKSVLLKWAHRDPADRVIVALAEELAAQLVTDDDSIKAFYKRAVF